MIVWLGMTHAIKMGSKVLTKCEKIESNHRTATNFSEQAAILFSL